MPNICENYVKITAPRAVLNLLIAHEMNPRTLVPAPEEYAKGSEAWWDWIQENHSTKWISNDTRDGPPVIEDRSVLIESHFISAWFAPYAFYQNFVRAHPETVIEYQYACWETSFVGYGVMRLENVEDEPRHFSYETPKDLNEAIRSNEGCWKVWTGNPHFDYDENTGLYNWIDGIEPTRTNIPEENNAIESDNETDSIPIPRPLVKKVVKKKKD
jgi:hypothetical protein